MRLVPVLLLAAAVPLAGCDPITFGGAVVGGAAVASDRRSLGSMVDDESIEIKIRSNVSDEKGLASQIHFDVTSYNGIVLITGQAPTPDLRDRVSEIARRIGRVRQVHNEMRIAAANEGDDNHNDGWITAKVKGNLIDTPAADGRHVKVTTEQGTVYLMGLVTRAQGNAAAEAARVVPGVQRVVKVFEYTD